MENLGPSKLWKFHNNQQSSINSSTPNSAPIKTIPMCTNIHPGLTLGSNLKQHNRENIAYLPPKMRRNLQKAHLAVILPPRQHLRCNVSRRPNRRFRPWMQKWWLSQNQISINYNTNLIVTTEVIFLKIYTYIYFRVTEVADFEPRRRATVQKSVLQLQISVAYLLTTPQTISTLQF